VSWVGARVRALEFYSGSPRAVVDDYVADRIMWMGYRPRVGVQCVRLNPAT
jgi:hypothetical protein